MLKVFLVGIMAVLTTGFSLVAWISLRPAAVVVVADVEAPPPPAAKVMILVVSRAVRPGELIKMEDAGAVEMLAAAVPEGAQVDSPAGRAEMAGAMVRRRMAAQQPVLPGDVLRPSDGGFLAAVLAPQHRAVSVAVDAVSGTAGLIWPGDRVDLILTQALDEASIPMGRRTFAETVLSDVRVIAVDQQLARGTSPDSPLSNTSQGARTVTLEVLPDAAERVAVAVRLGKVALSVRSLNLAQSPDAVGGDIVNNILPNAARPPMMRAIAQLNVPTPAVAPALKAAPTTWGYDVSPALNQRVTAPTTISTVRVFQGAGAEKEFKFE